MTAATSFLRSKNKQITLLGMSGVGKTHIAKMLAKSGDWFHYSGDYRIGSNYLNAAILDNIKQKINHDKWLKSLLDNKSIDVKNKITFNNLASVSSFLGKVGNPEKGGLPIDEFSRRQALHKDAEIKAMLDVPDFINQAKDNGFSNFINDAGGSLCELDDEKVYKSLAKNTTIIYIKADKKDEAELIKRAKTNPKPLYYQADFLNQQLQIYLQKNHLTFIAEINPDHFASWVFPKLLAHRLPKYQQIAKTYGKTISLKALHKCKNANAILTLIAEAL